MSTMPDSHVFTISRFLIEQEQKHPDATGRFTNLLHDIALAAKMISREVNKAGLVDILGASGDENVHGETVQKLDVFANQVMYRASGPHGVGGVHGVGGERDLHPHPGQVPGR